jgi:hypothetical protein
MATTVTTTSSHKYGSRDKTVGWYKPTLESINEAQRDLLENYSHIPPERVIPHILEIVSQSLASDHVPLLLPSIDKLTARPSLGGIPISMCR